MKKAVFSAIVQNNLDTSGDVYAPIDEAIKFISNFFFQRKEDDSLTVSTGDTTVSKPDRCHRVMRVKIGDRYLKEADPLKLQDIEDDSEQRWYVEDDTQGGSDEVIHFTTAVGSGDDGATVKVWFAAGFKPFGATDDDIEMPERLHPLVTVFASYFAMGGFVADVKNDPATFPGITLWDVVQIWETWRKQAFALLDVMRKQHYA